MKRLVLVLACLLLAFLALAIRPLGNPFSDVLLAAGAKVDPRVLEDTADGRTARFLVILADQADARAAAASAADRAERGRLVFSQLRQASDSSQPTVRAALDALGARYRAYWIVNMLAVEGDRATVEAMAARPDIKAVESDRAFPVALEQPENSPASADGIEWNVSKINAPALWAGGFRGQNLTYATADTGVHWTHPALRPQYRGWNGTSADHNYNWWDAIHGDIDGDGSNPCGFNSAQPCDDAGHGTHTTGTGVGDDGGANQIGVAPGAKWIACRNMEDGIGRPSTYIECMQFFLAPTDSAGNNADPDRRPDAVGNSYGCPPDELCSPNSLLVAMDNLRAAGVFMSVSAGNSGPSCSSVNDPPGLNDSAITVGATGSSDVIASFSSRGPVTVDGSGRRKPDLVAPGVNVRSAYPPSGYVGLSGTSMAAPHVAAAAILLWSAVPDLRRDVDRTEAILGQSALHLTSSQGCGGDSVSQVPNNVYGYGRIDVLAAYNLAITQTTATPTPTSAPQNTPTATPMPSATATPTATPGGTTEMLVTPGTVYAAVNVPLTLTVAISNVNNLGGFQFTLAYSHTLLAVEEATLADFPGSTGRLISPLGPTIDNNAGQATFGAFSMGATPPGPSGSGALARVRLRPVSSPAGGVVTLRLAIAQATDVLGAGIPIVGSGGTLYVSPCLGDMDFNGLVDMLDVQLVAGRWNSHAGAPPYEARYDIDADGDIDIIDIQMVAGRWNTSCSTAAVSAP